MIGDKSFFTNLTLTNDWSITFGDGHKALICCTGSIIASCIHKLNDVLFVEGIKANLISISQICDNNHTINLNKMVCTILDKKGNTLVRGINLEENCYSMDSLPKVVFNRLSRCTKRGMA